MTKKGGFGSMKSKSKLYYVTSISWVFTSIIKGSSCFSTQEIRHLWHRMNPIGLIIPVQCERTNESNLI